ncbi:Hypothetical predicted protein [Paramuricea clavata]|uniref:Uncharacterized protein n=1 Tax=Paramuricea clavata TaxID=317549 RepID=A0A6S7GH84_PARCT|nr:Hypothetical predicted protein [Paramuricea clavata]
MLFFRNTVTDSTTSLHNNDESISHYDNDVNGDRKTMLRMEKKENDECGIGSDEETREDVACDSVQATVTATKVEGPETKDIQPLENSKKMYLKLSYFYNTFLP